MSTYWCFRLQKKRASKLIFWDGTTRSMAAAAAKKVVAGEVMFEFPECMVLHADSFFIGRRIPALEAEELLLPGQTYFVIPMDRLPCNYVLSPASLSGLMSPRTRTRTTSPPRLINFGDQLGPFEYIRGPDGGVVSIKVVPEFIVGLLNHGNNNINININGTHDHQQNYCSSKAGSGSGNPSSTMQLLCTTPELKKQYDNLVRPKDKVWSPKLETISEYKVRFSPCRFIGLEWKQKEKKY
ncbi:hypothetical protein Dimus_011782 [Dionaea muscipula]